MTLETLSSHKCHGGTVSYHRHASDATATPMQFSVFVPPQAADGPVPTLTWLSGLTCTEENFTVKAGAQRHAAEHGLAVVCPDTSPRATGIAGEDDDMGWGSGAGFYVDATVEPWSAHYRMYSYVTEELPALVAANFPVSDRAGIFGHSMGGGGALMVALRNPGRYRSLSAFAPIAAPMRAPRGEFAFKLYLGEDREAWRAYDTCALLEDGSRFDGTILVDQGSADELLPNLMPEIFEQACLDAGQHITYRMQPGYDHGYFFISTFMGDHIAHHAAALNG